MAGDRAAPAPPAAQPGSRSVDSCSPLRSSGSSSGREEEIHLLLVSLDHCWAAPPRPARPSRVPLRCGAARAGRAARPPLCPARCRARGPGGRRWPRGAAGRWRRLALRNGKGGTRWAGRGEERRRRGERAAAAGRARGGPGCAVKRGLRRGGTAGVWGDPPSGDVTAAGTWRSPLRRVDNKENPGPAEARHKVGPSAYQADGTAKADPAAASQRCKGLVYHLMNTFSCVSSAWGNFFTAAKNY
ncbi:translation initiation factor IF-2-like [Coturnix japonica]|uniref:translation initiation factor IF-2-like n=1 Tax=Coturnix japonica TaxID=93934 RepID=UPI0013A5BFBA|nr:translation initiation factor IF-2-like [Coturnix japonica]